MIARSLSIQPQLVDALESLVEFNKRTLADDAANISSIPYLLELFDLMTRLQARLARLALRAVDPQERDAAETIRFGALTLASLTVAGGDRLIERVLAVHLEIVDFIRVSIEALPDPAADPPAGLVN